MRFLPAAALAAAILLSGSASMHAQAVPDGTVLRPVRALVGVNLILGVPVGELADNIDNGFGIAGHGTYLVHDDGYLGLRFDVGAMSYGRDRVRECLTTSCLVQVDVETTHNIAYVGFGPQLAVPDGPLRPYIGGNIGGTFFWTQSTIEGTNFENQPFASTTNNSTGTFAYGGHGGIMVPVNRGQTPVMIDIGARYHVNGDATYLTRGSIEVRPNQAPLIRPIRSEADFWTIYLGVTVGIR